MSHRSRIGALLVDGGQPVAAVEAPTFGACGGLGRDTPQGPAAAEAATGRCWAPPGVARAPWPGNRRLSARTQIVSSWRALRHRKREPQQCKKTRIAPAAQGAGESAQARPRARRNLRPHPQTSQTGGPLRTCASSNARITRVCMRVHMHMQGAAIAQRGQSPQRPHDPPTIALHVSHESTRSLLETFDSVHVFLPASLFVACTCARVRLHSCVPRG